MVAGLKDRHPVGSRNTICVLWERRHNRGGQERVLALPMPCSPVLLVHVLRYGFDATFAREHCKLINHWRIVWLFCMILISVHNYPPGLRRVPCYYGPKYCESCPSAAFTPITGSFLLQIFHKNLEILEDYSVSIDILCDLWKGQHYDQAPSPCSVEPDRCLAITSSRPWRVITLLTHLTSSTTVD